MMNRFRLGIAKRLAVYFTIILLLFALILGIAFSLLLYRSSRQNFISELSRDAASISDMVSATVRRRGAIIIGDDADAPPVPEDPSNDGDFFRPGGDIRINSSALGDFVASLTNATVWLIAPSANGGEGRDMLFLYRGESYTDTEFSHLGDDQRMLIESVFSGSELITDKFSGTLGGHTVTVGKPVASEGGTVIGVVLLHAPASGMYSNMKSGVLIMLISTLLAPALGSLGALMFSEKFTEPLRRINDTATRIAEGDFSARTEIVRTDEIGMLANTVDEMSAKLQAASEESERMETLRQNFITNISHELRTPVTVMRGSLEALCDKVITDDESVERYHQELLKESIYMQRLVNDLLDLTRLQNPDFSMNVGLMNLYDCIGDAVRSARRVGDAAGVRVQFEYDTLELLYTGDYDRVRQMFLIVLDNAVKFTDERKIPVKVELRDGKVSIENTGVGIRQEDIPFIFDRFYRSRTEQNRNGTGLGLAIAKQIAVRQGIGISVSSVPGGATTFMFDFGITGEDRAKEAAGNV